jgi:hypothetical protein
LRSYLLVGKIYTVALPIIVIPILRPNREHQHAQRRKREGKEKSTKVVNRIKKYHRIFLSPIQIRGYGLQPAQITKVQRDGRSFSKENPMPASLCSRGGAAFDKSREHVGTHIYIALSPRRHGSGPTQDIAGCDTLQQLSSTLDEISK